MFTSLDRTQLLVKRKHLRASSSRRMFVVELNDGEAAEARDEKRSICFEEEMFSVRLDDCD